MQKTIGALILFTALPAAALPASAAEWAPVFRCLEDTPAGILDECHALDSLTNNIFKDGAADTYHPNYKQHYKDPLTQNAKLGKYPAVPAPYRYDMLPAKVSKSKDIYLQATIPLQNATLYGKPLRSITYYYGCANCGDVGFYATFAPMSNAAYQNLKKRVVFAASDGACGDGAPMAEFFRTNQTVKLILNIGC